MRVLVVDNYDSFVYNLVQYLAQLGAQVTVRRNDAVDLDELDVVDGVLVSPGPGTPERAGSSIEVIRRSAMTTPPGVRPVTSSSSGTVASSTAREW